MKQSRIGPPGRISAKNRIRPVLNFTCNSPLQLKNRVSLIRKQLPNYDSPKHDLLKNAKDRAVAR